MQGKTTVWRHLNIQAGFILQIMRKLDQWLVLFKRYLHEISGEAQSVTIEVRYWRAKSELHLKIHYQNALIMFKTRFYDQETRFYDQLAHFSKHCDIVSGIPERGNQMGGSLKHTVDFSGFYHEHSVVPSLFLTASRRRGPHVRRRAILVLRRYRWREDIWDSEIAASLAEQLMLLEETGLRNIIKQECARIERPLLGSTYFLCLQLGGQVASSSRVVIPQSAPLQQHLYDVHS